jgi:hypothetical protein
MTSPIRTRLPTPPDGALREVELAGVKQSDEHTNTYVLQDGTLVSLRAVVTEVWRVLGQYDPEGNPLYIVKSGNVVTVTAPEALRRKTS